MSIKNSVYNGRTISGYSEPDGSYVDGWGELFSESTRAMNHLTRGTIPAPELYRILGNVSYGANMLPQLCQQLGQGLARSLDEYDVYDNKRDAQLSVDEARALLNQAATLAQQLGVVLDAAQVAISEQGYNETNRGRRE